MNIAQAEKKAKRLTEQLVRNDIDILLVNSLGDKNLQKDAPDIAEMFNKREQIEEEFIQLTVCIFKALEPMTESEVRKTELEIEIKFLRRLKIASTLSLSLDATSIMNKDEIEAIIIEKEKEIDNINQEIDDFMRKNEVVQLSAEKTT